MVGLISKYLNELFCGSKLLEINVVLINCFGEMQMNISRFILSVKYKNGIVFSIV